MFMLQSCTYLPGKNVLTCTYLHSGTWFWVKLQKMSCWRVVKVLCVLVICVLIFLTIGIFIVHVHSSWLNAGYLQNYKWATEIWLEGTNSTHTLQHTEPQNRDAHLLNSAFLTCMRRAFSGQCFHSAPKHIFLGATQDCNPEKVLLGGILCHEIAWDRGNQNGCRSLAIKNRMFHFFWDTCRVCCFPCCFICSNLECKFFSLIRMILCFSSVSLVKLFSKSASSGTDQSVESGTRLLFDTVVGDEKILPSDWELL